MRFSILFCAALTLSTAALAQDNTPSQQAQLAASSAEVARFHQQFNAGQYPAILAATAPAFQQSPTGANFVTLLNTYKSKMGDFVSQALVGQVATDNQAGNFTTQTFQVTLTKGTATESFVYQTIGGKQTLMHFQSLNWTTTAP